MANHWFFLILLPALLLTSVPCTAATTNIDLLIGLGGFEHYSDFAWQSAYSGNDCDWSANNAWVNPSVSAGWRSGYDICTPEDTLATGWKRLSSSSVNPETNQIYKLVDGQGVFASKAQYIALTNTTGSAYTILRHDRRIYPSLTNEPKVGDTLVFRIDSIKMTGYDKLPSGSVLAPSIMLILISGSTSKTYSKSIKPSETSSYIEISAQVPEGITEVAVGFKLDVNANLINREVGAYLDDAHLYVKRSASPTEYATWEIPAVKSHSIKTMLKYFDPSKHDLYETAQNFDYILSGDAKQSYNEQFRAINPDVKIFTYKSSAITKNDYEAPGHDPWYTDAPIQYNFAVSKHTEWLYPNGKGGYYAMIVYPQTYLAHVENADYQEAWANNVIAKMQLYGFDGIYLDDLNDATYDGVHIETVNCQKFIHAIMPKFRAVGLHVQRNGIMNLTYQNSVLNKNIGWILNNPFFTTSYEYPASEGFSNNTPYNVSDSYFQEWAFFKLEYTTGVGYTSNTYDKDFWLKQLQDMDLVTNWNTNDLVPYNVTKYMVMHSYGVDQPTDPAEGLDGWMHFALTSYLLAQNNYTMFGTMDRNDYSILTTDYSITKQLGAPDGTHFAYGGDNYFRFRRYKATDDGGLGGVVIVNANTTNSKTYSIDFDAIDESGNSYNIGARIKIPPHTGRIFLQRQLLNVTLSTNNESVYSGETTTVTVNYVNKGTQKLSNVVLRIQVPDQMTYVRGSAEKNGGTYYSSTKTIVWTISTIAAKGSGSRSFRATIN